jgi:hypothetical protein
VKQQDGQEETTAANNANGQPEASEDPDGDFYMQEVAAEIERRETRMNNFLNNPERMMQMFFSSWYKDKGLAWQVKIILRSDRITDIICARNLQGQEKMPRWS